MSASTAEYAKLYGNINTASENMNMAKCACVKCNSCTCACSCAKSGTTSEQEDLEW